MFLALHPCFLFPRFFCLVILTFLLLPSLTLILQWLRWSALWDWRKETLIPYLCVSMCVSVSVHMGESIHTALWLHACMHSILLVRNRGILVWIYKRIQWCSVEFSFRQRYCRKRHNGKREQTEKFVFCPLHHQTPITKHTPCQRKRVNDVWSSRLRWCSSNTLSYNSCFQQFGGFVFLLAGRWGQVQEEGWLQAIRWYYSCC